LNKNVEALISGKRVYLRNQTPTDLDLFIYWQTHGEWRHWDAPWEGFNDELTPEQEQKIRDRFLEICGSKKPPLRGRALIVAKNTDQALGWVNLYRKGDNSPVGYVGICICEDDALNQGLGSEALKLWIDFVFTQTQIHKLGLETWSFNPRMMQVAQKVGFRYEGAEREVRCWQGQWLDLVHYGMLRREWQNHKMKQSETISP
jgi:RimJ/RimL family protein N-acetyltransferase